jgi:hypothetical protein
VRNPSSAKTAPPAETAEKTPLNPAGMKPPNSVKLPARNEVAINATGTSTGTINFQTVMILLVSFSHWTPARLTAERTSSITAATPAPAPESRRLPSGRISQGSSSAR